MSRKKLFLTILIVAALLATTFIVVGAAGKQKITGGANYPYEDGRAKVTINVQKSVLGELKGTATYNSEWSGGEGYWHAEPVCAEFITVDNLPGLEDFPELNGKPAVILEMKILETGHLEVDTYLKFIMVDGGEPSIYDYAGLMVFPGGEEPVGCEYDPVFWGWFMEKGNIKIHK